MSLTLITGVPGSGKTLYAITKLLLPLLGTTVERTLDDGFVKSTPRRFFTNINGLQVEHELIDFNGQWSQVAKAWVHEVDPKRPNEALHDKGIHHWHQWAQPGDFLFLDEFQKAWPPRPNGAPVPPDIQALDTHRHMGVDMVLITQNCNNIDRHVLGLVDRHLHVRRMGNLGLAIVYEWDHASRSLLYKNAITKQSWRYDKRVFKLYKSAELHTKQRRSMSPLVWAVAAGVIGVAVLAPTTYNRLNERAFGGAKPPASAAKVAGAPLPHAGAVAALAASAVGADFAIPGQTPASAIKFAGCGSFRGVCRCYDADGLRFEAKPEFCEKQLEPNPVPLKGGLLNLVKDTETGPRESSRSDLEVIGFLRRNRGPVETGFDPWPGSAAAVADAATR